MNKKKYQKLLWGTGFVIIVLILTLFVMSQTYIQNLVYHERLSQMEEVTHQMFHSLEDVIDNHWDEVDRTSGRARCIRYAPSAARYHWR